MRIWLSAGELSGDRLGARLATELRSLDPGVVLGGVAGPEMRRVGVVPRGDAMVFAHSGWGSILRHLPRLAMEAFRLRRAAIAFRPDLFVAIDAPGANRILLRRVRASGIRAAWLAPPQLWAWRERNVRELSDMDVYPLHAFERDALVASGARAHWFGFPGCRPGAKAAGSRDLLALLPGSRPSWRTRHEPLFRDAAREAGLPLEAVVAVPEGRDPAEGEGSVDDVLSRSALALALPGTGVLESALHGVPTLVAARPGRFDLWIARGRVAPGPLSLPNRILGETVFPEMLGTPSVRELADALGALWARRDEVRGRLDRLADELGPPDAMAAIARDLLETRYRARAI